MNRAEWAVLEDERPAQPRKQHKFLPDWGAAWPLNRALVSMVAIVALVIVEIEALRAGLDGIVLGSAIAGIVGISTGFITGRTAERRLEKRREP